MAGDTVLKKVGAFLKQQIRASDIGCRYGGEEFVVIMPGIPLEMLCQRAESLRKGIKNLHIKHKENLLNITISLGVALFPQHESINQTVLQAADAALYAAKKAGRDMVCISGV